MERERLREINLRKKKEEMKEKEECLKRDLRRKDLQAMNIRRQSQENKEMNEIKSELKDMILKRRSKMSKKNRNNEKTCRPQTQSRRR